MCVQIAKDLPAASSTQQHQSYLEIRNEWDPRFSMAIVSIGRSFKHPISPIVALEAKEADGPSLTAEA
jgi:hypothetical protein